jgi:hypothetical protein
MLPVKSTNVAGELGLAWAVSGVAVALVGVGSMALETSGEYASVFYAAGGTLVLIGLATVVLSHRPASIHIMGTHGGAAPSGSTAKLSRMIELAETQLLALTMERSDINGRAMGVLAFDGALAVLFVAAGNQWHERVDLALVGLGLSVFLAARAVRSKPDVGPKPKAFLDELLGSPGTVFDTALLTRLSSDIAKSETSAERDRAGEVVPFAVEVPRWRSGVMVTR